MVASLNHLSATPVEADVTTGGIPVSLSNRDWVRRQGIPLAPSKATPGSEVNDTAATVAVAGQVVTVTVPSNIAANTNIAVELAGIVNPGTYGAGLTISVDDDPGGAAEVPTAPIPLADFAGAVPGDTITARADGIASPNTAGQLAEHQFTFMVNANVPGNVGEVRIVFDKDAQVPDLISQNGVQFQADLLTNALGTGSVGTGGGDRVVTATTAPTLDVDDDDPRRKELIVKVPDMDPTTGDVGQAGQGVQGIAAGARVRILVTAKLPTPESGTLLGRRPLGLISRPVPVPVLVLTTSSRALRLELM